MIQKYKKVASWNPHTTPINTSDVNDLFNKRGKNAVATNITLINLNNFLNNSIHNELETNFGYPSDYQFVTMLPATEDRQTGKRLARACMQDG